MRPRRVVGHIGIAVLLIACTVTGLTRVLPAGASPAPHISRVSPGSGPAGATVFIAGSGLFAATRVTFAGTSARFRVVNSSLIQTSVPRTAGSGPITVTSGFGSAASPSSFTITPSIWFSVPYAPPTTGVTVSGSGFGPNEQVSLSFDSTTLPAATTNSSGVFARSVTVPATAAPGSHTITATGQSSGTMASAPLGVNTDWSQLGFDPTLTGVNAYENVLSPTTVGQLTLDWTTTLGSDRIWSGSPAVVNGLLYVVASQDATNSPSTLYALDTTTGAVRWSHQVANQPEFLDSPAVVDGVVYVATSVGSVAALEAATGTLLWSVTIPCGWLGYQLSAPTVSGGIVYVKAQNCSASANFVTSGRLYALDAATGSILWKDVTGPGYGAPAVAQGIVYFLDLNDYISAANARTGALLWSNTLSPEEINPYASPVVANGLVYVGGSWNGRLSALNPTTGAVVWLTAVNVNYYVSVPAVDGDMLVTCMQNTDLVELNAATGVVVWSVPSDCGIEPPTVANGVTYATNCGIVYAYNAATGAALWSYGTPPSPGNGYCSSAVVANGTVYTGAINGAASAFQLPPNSVSSSGRAPKPASRG